LTADATDYYGRITGAPPRIMAAYVARQVADGALHPVVTVGPPAAGQQQQH
jgi:hypothetical protein